MAVMPGVEGAVDQNKGALLAAIAQQGSLGATAYEASAQRQQAAAQQAVQAVAQQTGATSGMQGAGAAATAQLQGVHSALNSVYAQDAASARGSYGAALAGISGSNAAYMDQARAAVPAIRAQTEGSVRRIQEEIAAERAEREFQAEQRRLDAIRAEEERAFAREQQGWTREDRAAEERLREETMGGMSDEEAAAFDAAIQDRRAGVYGEVAKDDDLGFRAPIFGTVTEDQPTLEGAIAQARQLLIQQSAADEAAGEEPWDMDEIDGELMGITRQLYAHYNPLEPTPSDDDLPVVLARQGFDPDKLFPSYVSNRDREQVSGRAAQARRMAALAEARKERASRSTPRSEWGRMRGPRR